MDKHQERNDKAIDELRANAAKFVALYHDATAAMQEAALLSYLTTAYYAGSANGCADEQEHHKAIGGCQR